MPISKEQIQRVANFCNQNLDLGKKKILSESYYYNSLPICVVDAVFSIGVKYQGVVNVVEKFCTHSGIKRHREYGGSFPNITDQYTVSAFNCTYGKLAPENLAVKIFENKQRTSSKNGILKAEAVQQRWMGVLEKHKINTFQELETKFENTQHVSDLNHAQVGLASFENDILVIPGQKSGISLGYFYMLAGRDNLVKPDRMIMRFLHEQFGDRNIQVRNAIGIINDLVTDLRDRHGYKTLTVRELDHAIWGYQRGQPIEKENKVNAGRNKSNISNL